MWLLILMRALLALPLDVMFVGILALLFTPLVYLPWLSWRAGSRGADAVGKAVLGAGSAYAFAGCCAMTALLLALFNFLGHWDKPGPGSIAALIAAVTLHVLGTLSIACGEYWLRLGIRAHV